MDVEGLAQGPSSLSVLNLQSQVFGRQPVSRSQVSLFVSCITSIPLQIPLETTKKTIYVNNNQKFNADSRS
jgi:hypothetical protein